MGEWRSSLFLAFVAVMSFSAARHGTRLLRRDGAVSLFDRVLPVALAATLTAFLVTNARSFGQGSNVWVWLSPTLVGVPLMTAWRRRYEPKSPTQAPP